MVEWYHQRCMTKGCLASISGGYTTEKREVCPICEKKLKNIPLTKAEKESIRVHGHP